MRRLTLPSLTIAATLVALATAAIGGCETREGEDCERVCTDLFDDCVADCDDDDCTIVCEDDRDVCVGACEVTDDAG